MSSTDQCRECGKPISGDSPGGFCASCLLALGLGMGRSGDGNDDNEPDVAPSGASEEGQSEEPDQCPPATRHKTGHGVDALLTEKTGDRIGRYRLRQEIGQGGCGVVYLAEQEQPIRRKVALKVIKLGMDTRQVVARFEAERQVLAMMDHPNIARVLDAGATDTGRPYFVMELVGGIKITDYCDRNHLTTRQRLELFIQVCRAIQHAHQKGIIHRDIKPSNVLVATQDGVAVPKVIDFGIAKATQGRLIDQTVFTAFEQFLGTPAYMSPEQTQLGSLDVDTRSDIYSLGVLLYELLTGMTPFDTTELAAAGLDEMRRTICEREPPPPSTLLGTLAEEELNTTARHRQSDAPKLIHLVRGDLDWIVMKCLEKDRARRYETANGLANDVERHLNQEPVVARPPKTIYRLHKFIRRNRVMAAAATALATTLLLGVGGVLWQWRRAEEHSVLEAVERRRAEEATQRAQAALTRMEAIEVHRAEEYYQAGDRRSMLPYLALVLRQNPSNYVAAERLFSTLSHRTWARLACPPLEHSNRVTFAMFSTDGQRVVTSAADNTAWVWDAATGQRLAGPFAHSAEINTAVFSPDGRFVVTASQDKTARVWNATTGAPVTQPLPYEGSVLTAQFSPDSRLVLATGGRVGQLWNVGTGQRVGAALKGAGLILDARFSPDGSRLAMACEGGQAQVWDVASGVCQHRFEHSSHVWSVAFSPDGRWLVTASDDKTARVWDVESGRPVGEPLHHLERIWGAEFGPDGQRLVTASRDHTAQIWDARNGQKLGPPLKHGAGVRSAVFSPEGLRVVTASHDNTVRVWDALTGEPLTEPIAHESGVFVAQFSPDGERVLTACNGKAALIWQVIGSPPLTIPVGASAGELDFSPDGGRLVVASDGAHTRVWDALTGQPLTPPLAHGVQNWINHAAFSPDGKLVATACDDRRARIFGSDDGRLVVGPLLHEANVRWVAFSPDGTRLLTTVDHCATVWNALSGEVLFTIRPEARLSQPACFSPTGAELLTATETGIARVWDAHSGEPVTPSLSHARGITMARFSPDGRFVLTAANDLTFFIWDKSTGRQLDTRWQHRGPVTSVAYSQDGKRVLTSTFGCGAQIWDLETGIPLTDEFGLRSQTGCGAAAFTHNESRVLLAYYDRTSQFWGSLSGQRLSEPLAEGAAPTMSLQCAGNGSLAAISCLDGSVRIWEVPLVGLPVPEWLPELAETLAGQRFNQQGMLESVRPAELWATQQKMTAWAAALASERGSPDPHQSGSSARASLSPNTRAARPNNARSAEACYARLARWFVADARTRTVLPSSPLTLPQHVQSLLERETVEGARQALLLQPTNVLAMGALALTTTNSVQADWLSLSAFERAPSGGTLWARQSVLRNRGRIEEALALLERNPSLWKENPWFWGNKGEMLGRLGRLEDSLTAYNQAILLARITSPAAPEHDRLLWKTPLDHLLLQRCGLLKQLDRPAEAQLDFLEANHIPARADSLPQRRFATIDLRSHLNQPLINAGLTRTFGATNATAPVLVLGGVEFELPGYIWLNQEVPDQGRLPRAVGILVGQACSRLHFLHNCTRCTTCPDGVLVGAYVVQYVGGVRVEIPLTYGEQVRDCIDWRTELSHASTGWMGRNDNGELLRLVKFSWQNPYPERRIESIDFLAQKPGIEPILFAITAE